MKDIFFRIIVVFLILAGGYTLYGIGHFKWMYHSLANPSVDFLIKEADNPSVTIIEFTNYTCGYCKELYPLLNEVQVVRKDIRLVTRPVIYGEEGQPSVRLVQIAMAAGLQGYFDEFHQAFMEYPEPDVPDDIIRELCNIYGLNYDELITQSKGKQVDKIIKNNMTAFNASGTGVIPSFLIGQSIYTIPESGLPDLKALLHIIAQAQGK